MQEGVSGQPNACDGECDKNKSGEENYTERCVTVATKSTKYREINTRTHTCWMWELGEMKGGRVEREGLK